MGGKNAATGSGRLEATIALCLFPRHHPEWSIRVGLRRYNMGTGIVFPHQLFEHNVLAEKCDTIYLVEEGLFCFKQRYTFFAIHFCVKI